MVKNILFKRYRNTVFQNYIKDYIINYINNLDTTTKIPESSCNKDIVIEKFISKFTIIGFIIENITQGTPGIGESWKFKVSIPENNILNGKPPYTYIWSYDVHYFTHSGSLENPFIILELPYNYNIQDIISYVTLTITDSRKFTTSKSMWLHYGVLKDWDFETLGNATDLTILPDYTLKSLSFSWINNLFVNNNNVIGQNIVYNRINEPILINMLYEPLDKEITSYTFEDILLGEGGTEYFIPNCAYKFRHRVDYPDNKFVYNDNGYLYFVFFSEIDFEVTEITENTARIIFDINIYNSDITKITINITEAFGDNNLVFTKTSNISADNLMFFIQNLSSGNLEGKEYRIDYILEFEKDNTIIKSSDYNDLQLWGGFFTQSICRASYNVLLTTSFTPTLNITASWLNINPTSLFNVYYKKRTDTEYILSGSNVSSPYIINDISLEQNTLYDVKIETIGWNTNAFIVRSIKTGYINVAPVIESIQISSNNISDEITPQERPVIINVQLLNNIL